MGSDSTGSLWSAARGLRYGTASTREHDGAPEGVSARPILPMPKRRSIARDSSATVEAAAWYWHFVDVVWLFLFCAVYWWGAGEIAVGH